MSIDAMKQALEALEYIENNYMSLPSPAIKAIAALRLAIEQAEKQESYWKEEARRYAGNADFWREKAALVAAAERAACAKVCENIYAGDEGAGDWPTPEMCAAAIRARGEKK
jgi:hypothetical protein